jgi:hypothetical protein
MKDGFKEQKDPPDFGIEVLVVSNFFRMGLPSHAHSETDKRFSLL